MEKEHIPPDDPTYILKGSEDEQSIAQRMEFLKFPYAIIYSIEPDHIRIIAVAHNKRKPGYWLIRPSRP